jgi:Phage integrase, N-terminal SAM-like domain
MTSDPSPRPVSPLRTRMIEDMTVRGFNEHTRRDYVRHVRSFAAFIGRSPDTATAEELRRFQLHQTQSGMQSPGIDSESSVVASADRSVLTLAVRHIDQLQNRTRSSSPGGSFGHFGIARATCYLRKKCVACR